MRELITDNTEFVLELVLVVGVGDAEIEVRVGGLLVEVGRVGGADGHDGGRALSPLRPAPRLQAAHRSTIQLTKQQSISRIISSARSTVFLQLCALPNL